MENFMDPGVIKNGLPNVEQAYQLMKEAAETKSAMEKQVKELKKEIFDFVTGKLGGKKEFSLHFMAMGTPHFLSGYWERDYNYNEYKVLVGMPSLPVIAEEIPTSEILDAEFGGDFLAAAVEELIRAKLHLEDITETLKQTTSDFESNCDVFEKAIKDSIEKTSGEAFRGQLYPIVFYPDPKTRIVLKFHYSNSKCHSIDTKTTENRLKLTK